VYSGKWIAYSGKWIAYSGKWIAYSGKWIVDSGKRVLKNVLIACLSLLSLSSFEPNACAQTSADDSIFAAKIKQAKAEKIDTLPIGARVAAMGKLFLGTPYVAGTLDVDTTKEQLVVNLRGFDCVTFYENMLAFARILKEEPHPSMEGFKKELTYLRYRNGIIDSYYSRLHYTIDYFYNGDHKRILHNATLEIAQVGAKNDPRQINFMTAHRVLYPQISKNDAAYNAMLQVERAMNARKDFYYIPKYEIQVLESKIKTGDIIAVTTDIPGLDCSHTGIAIRMPDGRIHFMHASSLMGNVIISDEPLAKYLTHNIHQTGIIVARPDDIQRLMPRK
jgi:hypothetical protein